nr:GGDEF domain-containing protein [Vibrio agarilyticus]
MFVILSGYLAYTIVSPISYLTHQAQLLASGGDVTIKPLKRNDEIGELSLAFEKMAITIQSKQQSLTEQAHHDPLTGILNRRALLEDATSTIRANASVCMMDLDHFKQINDQFGHAAGDAVLQYFCELVKAEIRTHDIFGRIGGEEFTLVLPQTHLEQAVKLAERIREKTEQHLHTVLTSPAPFPVTVSIGVTEWRSGDFHKVLSRADQCLYQAKRAGRNQVIATTDQPSS